MSKSAGHPRFHLSTYYVEVLWEHDLIGDCDTNSYDDNSNPMTENDANGDEDENHESEGWEHFLKTFGLQILQIIVEVLVS
jgi:hypothetical protein